MMSGFWDWQRVHDPHDIITLIFFLIVFLTPAVVWLVWSDLRRDTLMDRLADAIGGRRLTFFSNPYLIKGSVDGIPCTCHYMPEGRSGRNILRIRLQMRFRRLAYFEAPAPLKALPDQTGDTSMNSLRTQINELLDRPPHPWADMLTFERSHAELTLYEPRPDLDLAIVSRFAAVARDLAQGASVDKEPADPENLEERYFETP